MTKGNKIIIFALIFVIAVCLGASIFLISISMNLNTKKISPANSNNLKNQAINNSRQFVINKTPLDYLKSTLNRNFMPDTNPIFRIDGVYTNGTVMHRTPTWTKDGADIYFQIFNSIKGDIYKEDDMPLDYDILARKELPKSISDEEKFNMLNIFYYNNPGMKFSSARKFTLNKGMTETNIYSFNQDGTANTNSTKKIIIPDNTNVIEYMWQSPDKTLETRAVWKIGETDTTQTDYFVACKIFPESPLYAKKSCFSGSP